MWPAPMRSACGSTISLCPARRTMTPLRAPARVAALPTARGRIAFGLLAGGRDSEIRANGNPARVIRAHEIPTSAIRATGTVSPHDVAMTAPQRGRAGRKGQPDHKVTVAQGLMPMTAHPGGAAARLAKLAKLAEQAGATVGGAHNIPNCHS